MIIIDSGIEFYQIADAKPIEKHQICHQLWLWLNWLGEIIGYRLQR